MNEKNKQYAILDKILNESQQGRSNRRWVCTNQNNPDEGYWIDSEETFEQLKQSVDKLEAFLRS